MRRQGYTTADKYDKSTIVDLLECKGYQIDNSMKIILDLIGVVNGLIIRVDRLERESEKKIG